ncbi:helix-turn-helix domain-containing protein [Streptomyces sp. HNM0645]|uniref:helix-turn-helix domain-containing protein n=1 Tax=Streptomyces sp. HNM0645 TaxID=2782343 RepID=UPI0024B84B94|nr:helix-turn-helix domain-containing protein [Streptomyces sp. HNM0645]MDI9887336.1 helix-turn-helix domain-containing protein [Streptomyces sp. HNM0645]
MNFNGTRFTPEQRDELRAKAIEMYADSATMTEIADALGCSVGTVRNFLNESDVELRPRGSHPIDLPDGMLTSTEAAALIGIGRGSFLALQHKGYGPPRAESPQGAHGHYTYYWRKDVELWLSERAERRLERARRAERTRELSSIRPTSRHIPNWSNLFAEVDAKRETEGLTWDLVSRMSGVNPSQISRLRNGQTGNNWGTFLRILSWLEGGMPEPLRKYVTEVPASRKADDQAA